LKDTLPEDNELLDRTYGSKKIMCSMGMNYKRIHACPNDCILYRKDNESLESYPACEVDWYKKYKNKISAKVL